MTPRYVTILCLNPCQSVASVMIQVTDKYLQKVPEPTGCIFNLTSNWCLGQPKVNAPLGRILKIQPSYS